MTVSMHTTKENTYDYKIKAFHLEKRIDALACS